MTNIDPEAEQLRALVAQSPTIARAIEERRMQEASDIAAGKSLVQLLQRSGPMWLKGAEPATVAAFARVCVSLELNPLLGEAYLMHGTLYVGIAGRRKRAIQTGEYDGEGTPRLATPEEHEIYGIHEGDVARIVQVWRKGVRMPGEACGIVRAGELKMSQEKRGPDGLPYQPLGRDPEGMAAKRAATGAYKKVFGDLDLPTADIVQTGRRVTITDVDSGRTLIDQVDEPLQLSEGDVPERTDVDVVTGEIIDQPPTDARPHITGVMPLTPTGKAEAAERALDSEGVDPSTAPGTPEYAAPRAEAAGAVVDDAPLPEPPPTTERPGPRRRGESAGGRLV